MKLSLFGTLDRPGQGWFPSSTGEFQRWLARVLWTETFSFFRPCRIELVPGAGLPGSLHYYLFSDRLFFDAMMLDRSGVPIQRSQSLGLFHNPAYIAWYGLMSLEKSQRERLRTDGRFATQVEWLLQNAIRRDDGSVVWPFPVDVREGRCTLRSPWVSAMIQGLAISLLVRANRLNPAAPELAEIASRAANVFGKGIHEGGVRTTEGGATLYEEYPAHPLPRVLDGFLFSLLGLYDLSVESGDPLVTKRFKEGVQGLVNTIDSWNYKDRWTWYGTHGYLCPRHYHDLNRLLVLALANLTGEERLYRFANAWDPARLNARGLWGLFMKFFFLKQASRTRSLLYKIGWRRRNSEAGE
jgi:hypothetical protein